MAKSSGGVRIVGTYTNTEAGNRAEFYARLNTKMYEEGYSSISEKTGAYVLYMKGHNYHRDEVEAAKALADDGINVILTPEGAEYNVYATTYRKNQPKFSEGYVNFYSYEQRTPTSDSTISSIKKALRHTNDKHADVCVIYDKYGSFKREDIEYGMKSYQQHSSQWKHIKAVLVINSKRKVYEHYFDK